jgi:hypothetical protein
MSLFGGSKPALSQQPPAYNALRIQTSTSGMVIPVVFGTTRVTENLLWAGDFTATPHASSSGGGGKGGGGGGSPNITYTYSVSFIMGLCEGLITNILQTWAGKALEPSYTAFGLTGFAGSYPQAVWGYMTSNHPTEALNYPGIAGVECANFDLGTSDALPNFTFEVQGLNIVGGLNDANPSDIITQMITNTKFGLVPSFPLDVSDYATYCLASNFLLSPAFTEQKNLADHIQDILDQSNSTCIWHDAQTLRIVPFGDTSVTANSTTWTPNVTPLYDLTDDDFLGDNTADPIKVTRKSPAQAENDVKVEFFDRANGYNVSVAEAYDQGSIDLYIKRPSSTKQHHAICQASIAASLAQLIHQRQLYIRNEYEFQLSGLKYGHLEPMDTVTLTDLALGLNKFPVRIIQIDENEDWDLDVTAEDFPQGVGHAATYGRQAGSGYAVNYNVAPGNVNTPVIFNAPGALTATGYEIWCALSGGVNWGGCDIYASTDAGSSYKFITRLYGASRYGVLTAPLAIGADPDTTHTCAVDLTTSNGALLSGTQADADNKITLCLVDSEMISYQTATLTSANHYNLTAYLRRGCYGSAIAPHLTNAQFVRLDDQLAKIAFDPSLIGQTLYLKFLSFNTFQLANQNLADVSPYTYVIGAGLSFPGNIQNFNASQNGVFVIFSWDNINDAAVAGYEIRYNQSGNTKWGDGSPITKVEKGTHLVSLKVAPGSWTFLIAAIDKSGNYSQTPATYTMTVSNPNFPVITLADEATLGWPGLFNLFANGTFATNITGWAGWNSGTVAWDAGGYSGGCLKVTAGASPSGAFQSAPITVTANALYNLALRYKCNSGSDIAGYWVYDNTHSAFIVNYTYFANSVTWSALQPIQFTTPVGCTSIYVGLIAQTNGQIVFFDEVSLALTAPYLIVHPSNVLVPLSQGPASGDGWNTFDKFCPVPYATYTYVASEKTLSQNQKIRALAQLVSNLGPGELGVASPQLNIKWHAYGVAYNAFTPWDVGDITAIAVDMEFILTASVGLAYIASFIPMLDMPTRTEPNPASLGIGVSVSHLGTAITYGTPFNFLPNVQATAIGASGLVAVPSAQTVNGFTLTIYNSAGTAVDGAANWQAQGV